MGIQILIKIGAVGILVALLNLAGLIIVLSWLIPYIKDLFNAISEIMSIGG